MDEKETLETETDELVNDSPEEEQVTSEQPEGEQTPDKTEKTDEKDKDFKSALAQKEHYRKKYEALKAETEQKKEVKEEEPVPEEPKTSTEEKVDQIDFLIKNKDVPPEAMSEISAYARGKGISLEAAKKADVISSYLKNFKEKSRKEEATPEPSSRSSIVKEENFADLSEKDKAARYPEIQERVLRAVRKKEAR